MKYIKCPHCNAVISKKEATHWFFFYPECPRCRKDIKFKNKFFAALRQLLRFSLFLTWFIFLQTIMDLRIPIRIIILIVCIGIAIGIDRLFLHFLIKGYQTEIETSSR